MTNTELENALLNLHRLLYKLSPIDTIEENIVIVEKNTTFMCDNCLKEYTNTDKYELYGDTYSSYICKKCAIQHIMNLIKEYKEIYLH